MHLKKVSLSKQACGKAFRMAIPKCQDASVTDISLDQMVRLLSNEKYTGRVLLQKTVSTGTVQIENNGLMDWFLYTDTYEVIISDEMFMAVQQEKLSRSKKPQNHVAMKLSF